MKNKEQDQLDKMDKFINQVDLANSISNILVIMGDFNLCSRKWALPSYSNANVSKIWLDCLDQNGMRNIISGDTYFSDRQNVDRSYSSSALDHVYINKKLAHQSFEHKILNNKATDHLPVQIKIPALNIKVKKQVKMTKVRNMKNVTRNSWNNSLNNE